MIKDKNNARYVYFGHGTIGLCRCQDGTSYAIYNSEQGKIDGEYTDSIYKGQAVENIPVKSIAFVFNGEKAIKSIDILIEDLQIIRENLISECEVE